MTLHVRDLRYRFSVVEALLREGEEIQITKRKRVIAHLLPPEPKKSRTTSPSKSSSTSLALIKRD